MKRECSPTSCFQSSLRPPQIFSQSLHKLLFYQSCFVSILLFSELSSSSASTSLKTPEFGYSTTCVAKDSCWLLKTHSRCYQSSVTTFHWSIKLTRLQGACSKQSQMNKLTFEILHVIWIELFVYHYMNFTYDVVSQCFSS